MLDAASVAPSVPGGASSLRAAPARSIDQHDVDLPATQRIERAVGRRIGFAAAARARAVVVIAGDGRGGSRAAPAAREMIVFLRAPWQAAEITTSRARRRRLFGDAAREGGVSTLR